MKHKKILAPLVLGTCLFAAVSCGNDDDDSSSTAAPPPQQEEQQEQGTYTANLTTLNPGVGGNAATGTATFNIEGNQIIAMTDVTGAAPGITHAQHVHLADSCPTMEADTNGDGFLDVVEGVPAYGPILIPLDGDLSSQSAGASGFPSADSSGSFQWSEQADLNSMIEDLTAEDPNPADAVAKLNPGEELNFEGRHVVILGVPSDTNLPDSVSSINDLPAEATLPIACGRITRTGDTGTTTGGTGTTTGDTGTGTTTGGGTGTGTTTGGTGTGTTTGGDTGTTTGDDGETTVQIPDPTDV